MPWELPGRITVIGMATFAGGTFFGIVLVVATGIRTEGQLAWPWGLGHLRDDPASRLAQGLRRINGAGMQVRDMGGRPSGAARLGG